MQKPYEIPMRKIELSAMIQLRDYSLSDIWKYDLDIWHWFMHYDNWNKYLIVRMPTNSTENIKYQYICKRWRKPKSILYSN